MLSVHCWFTAAGSCRYRQLRKSGATLFYRPSSCKSNRADSSYKENVNNVDSAIDSSHTNKEALKRQKENALYEQNKEVILEKLQEAGSRNKAKPVLANEQHTPLYTLLSNIFSTGLSTGLTTTCESEVILPPRKPTIKVPCFSYFCGHPSPSSNPAEFAGGRTSAFRMCCTRGKHRKEDVSMQHNQKV